MGAHGGVPRPARGAFARTKGLEGNARKDFWHGRNLPGFVAVQPALRRVERPSVLGTLLATHSPVTDGLTHSVQALGSAEKRMETIAANLANLSAPGFKRSADAMHSFDSVLGNRVERRTVSRRETDFSQGTLQSSGNTYDLALHGRGFFTVEGAQGELYTRDGRFLVDDKGVLQTQEGLPVAWEGARGTVDPTGATVTVDAGGTVRQGDAEVGQLRIVDFDRPSQLVSRRGGFFEAPAQLAPRPSEAEVRQGYIEQANVSAVDELVAMIAVQRRFEMGTRVMGSIEQSYRRLTNPR